MESPNSTEDTPEGCGETVPGTVAVRTVDATNLNGNTYVPIAADAIAKMKVTELKYELRSRSQPVSGIKVYF